MQASLQKVHNRWHQHGKHQQKDDDAGNNTNSFFVSIEHMIAPIREIYRFPAIYIRRLPYAEITRKDSPLHLG